VGRKEVVVAALPPTSTVAPVNPRPVNVVDAPDGATVRGNTLTPEGTSGTGTSAGTSGLS
jgi:hypothetical protein